MVFVDTGAWFARYVPADPNHAAVLGWFESNREPLVTTDYCVDETLTLLAARGLVTRAIEVGHTFFQGNLVRIHYVSPRHIHRAWILFQQRAASGWSFTDCTSKIVTDESKIQTAIALDQHFRQFGNVAVLP